MGIKKLNRWLLALFLLLPVLLLNYSHFKHGSENQIPSFFLQDDMPYYMAIAREYFDGGTPPLSYGNPFSPDPETKRHYFQPPTLLLGILWNFTRIDPGLLFMLFGIPAALLAIRTTISLFEYFHPLIRPLDLSYLLIFIWGGGLLSLGGLCFSLSLNQDARDWLLFDPSGGWWFLNLGRNFIYPLESIYHLLFFLGMIFGIRKQWALTLTTGFLLSICHPFTGIQFLLILTSWLTLEYFLDHNQDSPSWCAPLTSLILLLGHLGYYLIYLVKDLEHQSMMTSWKISFSMHEITFLLNLLPLFFMVWWGLRKKQYPLLWLQRPAHRLLLCGFFITLGLVFHDRIIPPIQPLHFDRGYLWTFLFFIALPGTHSFIRSIQKKSYSMLSLLLLLLLFLSDNASWLTAHILKPTGHYHTIAQKKVFDWLNENATPQDLFVSEDRIMTYLSPTYSSVRPWYAFWWFTPFSEKNLAIQKTFFKSGKIPEEWKGRSILILQPRTKTASQIQFKKLKLFQNSEYQIWQIRPQ